MRLPALVALFAPCALLAPASAAAQTVEVPAGVSAPALPSAGARADSAANTARKIHIGPLVIPRRDSSWWVPLASAVVPGTGQALLGQDRFIAYLAVEAFSFLGYLDQRNQQWRATAQYESLANSVARSLYPGNLPAGSWAYYEAMEHYIESGVYNLVPGGTFTPEVDVTTYNGALWLLARQNYWSDPNVEPDPNSSAYHQAIAFYLARAIQPQFRWSWRDAQLEQDVYVRTIDERNQDARNARLQMGILIANHVLSMVDSYITLRVHGGLGAPGSPTSLSATIPWAPFGRPSNP
jgi:hypothetical protein